MAVTIDYEKLPTGGNITWVWVPAGGIVDVDNPQVTELNAVTAINASASISVNDTDFGTQASNTTSDPSFADTGNVQDRGASQYGGSVSMYYPKNYDDATNPHSVVYDALDTPRTPGFWVIRIDGETSNSTPIAAGQYVSVFEAVSDGETNALGGEEAQKRAANFLSRGNLAVYTVAASGAPVLGVPSSISPAPGEKGRLEAQLNGRFYGGVEWSTSDPAVVEVWPGGFYTVTGADADTATITVRHKGQVETIEVTVAA